jgi:hypothetical protein
VNNIVMAYEDTSHGTFKYAVQFKDGWKTMSIDGTTPRVAATRPSRLNRALGSMERSNPP